MQFSIIKSKKESLINRETSAAKFIPYKSHFNHNTLLTKKDELVRVIKIKGFSFETADDIDVDLKKNTRNNLLKSMAQSSFSLHFHTIRRKEKAFPDGEMPDDFSKQLNQNWSLRHSDDKCFVNEHFLTIIRGQVQGGVIGAINLVNQAQQKTSKAAWAEYIKEAYGELEEMTERILNGFSNYSPQLLEVIETDDGFQSEILNFFGRIINCGYQQNYLVPTSNIDNYLPVSRLYIGAKSIEVHNPDTIKYTGLVSIKEYRPATHAGVFDGFMQMPFELIISQSFVFTDRMVAIGSMQLQQRRLMQSEDVAVSQIREIDEALDSAMGGAYAFGNHYMTVMCIEDSQKSLESALSMASVELANSGITGVREKINLEPAFWSQLPGNASFMARASTINTLNLASFASFHNYPSGKRKGNHWGDAVTVLNTVSGTPYFFSFHVRDVGHTMIIGPTGAGKTVLLNFLCSQSQKFNGRLFFFDKDRGAEIFIRAVGGKYMIPTASKVSGFNPLQLPDNSQNRAFLVELLKALVSTNGEILGAHEIERINEAVNGNYKLPKQQRMLRNIAPFMGLGGPGSLANRLSIWHSNGSHARLFDNENDNIDFSIARNFGIEMGYLLQDKVALAPALLYLFHRIQSSLKGEPTMIVLDEAWALIGNPVFAPKIKDWLKVMRKLNSMVVFATQSVEDASKSEISDTLVQQTATQIFLPNLRATQAYRNIFMLSEREFSLVKSTDPSTRFFLVKQDNDGVVARLDLSGMDNIIQVLSGRNDTVALLDRVIDEHGEDPKDWLPIFYQKAQKLL